MQHHGHGVGVGQINGVCEDGGNRDGGRKGNNIVGIMVGNSRYEGLSPCQIIICELYIRVSGCDPQQCRLRGSATA